MFYTIILLLPPPKSALPLKNLVHASGLDHRSYRGNTYMQVIVLDEAHNIEDSAREAVSGTFDIDDIAITMKGLLLPFGY